MDFRNAAAALAALGALSALTTHPAHACCMAPGDYTGRISQTGHQGIILHAEDREELILKIGVGLTAADRMPDRIAWVVTVPSIPDGYDADLSSALFREADQMVEPQSRWATKGIRMSAVASIDVKVIHVGPYEIHQINTVGSGALQDLNRWLHDHGFPPEDPEHMKPFVEADVTWLCIQARPQEGERFSTRTDLPPLRISFSTDRPFYPLRFSSRQGAFPLNLFVFSDRPVDPEASAAVLSQLSHNRRPISPRQSARDKLRGKEFKKLVGKIRAEGRMTLPKTWHVARVRAGVVNSKANPIAEWATDIYLNTAEAQ